jgi:chromosome partitioning protein
MVQGGGLDSRGFGKIGSLVGSVRAMEAKPRGPAPRITTVCARKGGTAKTTTAIALAAAIARAGRRVVLVDLDPQASATRWLAKIADDEGVCDALTEGADLRPFVTDVPSVPNLGIIRADVELAGTERAMLADASSVLAVAAALRTLEGEVVVDTGPSFQTLTVGAVLAADRALVPVSAEGLATQTLSDTLTFVQRLAKRAEHLDDVRVVLTRVDMRYRHSGGILETLREHLGAALCATTVPTCGDALAAPSERRAIDPGSRSGRAYAELLDELDGKEVRLGEAEA